MTPSTLTLKLLEPHFGILKLPPTQPFPDWLAAAQVYFVARTADELSVMCPETHIPPDVTYSAGWRCLRVDGDLAFDEVGVAARLARPLAEAGLSIFVVSTHDRDYVLVAEADLAKVIFVYQGSGFKVTE